MAILKHKSSKNASYSNIQEYLTYKHRENPETGQYDPILDEFGLLQERENYALAYIDGHGQRGDPDDWADACWKTNLCWHKNHQAEDVKQHQYIIAHPESDNALMNIQDLLEEGIAFARENLPGYDAFVAAHMDKNHPHVHIVINSVRSVERQEEPWMIHDEDGDVWRCEVSAGGKHQDSYDFRRHCQEWLVDYTRTHGWAVKDNLMIEDQRKSEKQNNSKIELAKLLTDTASHCASLSQLQAELKNQHNIDLIRRGHTYTVHLPDRKKGVRLDTIGLSPEDLLHTMGLDQSIIDRLNQADGAKKEKKRYNQSIREQRLKNAIRAEDLISAAEQLLPEGISGADKEQISAVRHLIRQTTYVERDLETELGKMEHIHQRWLAYLNSPNSEERNNCCGYIRWAGYDPDSTAELEELQTMIQMAKLQIEGLKLKRSALIEISPSCLYDYNAHGTGKGISEASGSSSVEEKFSDICMSDGVEIPSEASQQGDSTLVDYNLSHAGTSSSKNWWTENYKQAKKYLYGSKTETAQPELAYSLMKNEASTGNGFALHDLAKMHMTGLGCEQDNALAQKLFLDAYNAFVAQVPHEKKPAYLQYRIGKLFLQGYGVQKNYTSAAEWLEKSSAVGNPYAAYSLAGLYRRGHGVDPDEEKAFALYQIAATNSRAPNAYAAYELGNMCKSGIGTEANLAESRQWYKQAYDGFLKLEQSTMDDTLLYRMGQMNQKGMGTTVDIPKAISYYEKAAKLGNTNALYGLGMLYLDSSLAEYDPQKAVPCLEKAAERDNQFAQYQLGKMYLTGGHVEKNSHAAINLFTAAAENGSDMAMYQLGKIFYYGELAPQNTQRAIKLLKESANENNSSALALLGKIYLSDENVRDKRKGMALLQKAASLNNSAAQYQLGKTLYYSNQHPAQAIAYLRKAADQDHVGAMALLGKILIAEGQPQDIETGINLLLTVKSQDSTGDQDNTGCKELLAEIKRNKKKYADIAAHYQSRANRLKYDSAEQTEAVRFRQMWHNQLEAERYLKKEIKAQRRDARSQKSDGKETQNCR